MANLILHANELCHINNKPPIRSLEQIRFNEIQDYLLSFNVDRLIFEQTLEVILRKCNSKVDINWDLLKSKLSLTTRKFDSLKHKLTLYLKSVNVEFRSLVNYSYEYPKANNKDFDSKHLTNHLVNIP